MCKVRLFIAKATLAKIAVMSQPLPVSVLGRQPRPKMSMPGKQERLLPFSDRADALCMFDLYNYLESES